MATRTSSPGQKGPLFTGILIGLFLGLAIAIAVALFIRRNDPFIGHLAPARNAAAPAAPPTVQGVGSVPPASLIAAPAPPEIASVGPQLSLPSAPGSAAAPTAPSNVQYYLQAGAFQNPDEAQALKAELALLGLDAHIQSVENAAGVQLQHVRLGPYTDLNQVNATRQLLTQNNINADLIKITPIP